MQTRAPIPSSSRQGMTILEVMIALSVLALLLSGILAALLQAHRMTQESIYQNAARASVQGAVEQMLRSISFANLPYTNAANTLQPGADASTTVPIVFNGQLEAPLALSISTSAIPDAGVVPSGASENLVNIDVNYTPGLASDDMELRLWLRGQDVSDSAIDATQVRAITVVYQWRFFDGSNSAGRWHLNSVRNIRSAAPNF